MAANDVRRASQDSVLRAFLARDSSLYRLMAANEGSPDIQSGAKLAKTNRLQYRACKLFNVETNSGLNSAMFPARSAPDPCMISTLFGDSGSASMVSGLEISGLSLDPCGGALAVA